ncbi:MAG: hypothetical protein H6698_05650 [Myxococcales bacterium]|nr:hypothetical protein [Myxococcales bacterium]MCB9521377.1 hypothetical protein [Myxococcales bacterium]MCB9532552.1 hypothetical protein [Myxococcales bacterium]MCB9533788.1 hypothetical protein [Myxococcales bacterium]
MDSGTQMFVSMMVGVVGLGYLTYGWRQRHIMATVAGLGMSIFPMVISDPIVNVVLCIGLGALPWFLRF